MHCCLVFFWLNVFYAYQTLNWSFFRLFKTIFKNIQTSVLTKYSVHFYLRLWIINLPSIIDEVWRFLYVISVTSLIFFAFSISCKLTSLPCTTYVGTLSVMYKVFFSSSFNILNIFNMLSHIRTLGTFFILKLKYALYVTY